MASRSASPTENNNNLNQSQEAEIHHEDVYNSHLSFSNIFIVKPKY